MVAAAFFVGHALVACGSDDPVVAAHPGPDGGSSRVVEPEPDRSPAPTSPGDAGADADAAPVCKKEHDTLGMACLQANDQVCPTGGECYGILLRNVCGPTGRKCDLATSPTCGGGQTCRKLRVDSDDGICLTDDEAVCFCGNIGVSLRPPSCPIADHERPGVDALCSCPDGAVACVSESGKGPCQPGLACIRGACRGKACTGPADCAADEICLAYAEANGDVVGHACRKK